MDMGLQMKIHPQPLNGFSWTIISVFICASFAMRNNANSYFYEILNSLPLILSAIYWSEKSGSLISINEHHLKNKTIFSRDVFLLSFSFFTGFLISLCLAYNNSDAKGWWTLFIYLMTIYGLIFSFVFSIFALLIKNHKTYALMFSFLIITLASFGNFLPQVIRIDTFYLITGLLLAGHCLFAIIYKITQAICNPE